MGAADKNQDKDNTKRMRGTITLHVENDELVQEMRTLAKQVLVSVTRSEIQSEISKSIASIPRRMQEEYEKSWSGSRYQQQYMTLIYQAILDRVKNDETWKSDLAAEILKRADTSYLEHADKAAQELNDASVINPWWKEDDNRLVGWYPPSHLQHIKTHSLILAYFPYDDSNAWCCFDPVKHKHEYDKLLSYNMRQGGYYLLVMKHYFGYSTCCDKYVDGEVGIPVDITKATRFTVFAATSCSFTKEGLIEQLIKAKQRISDLQRSLHVKNLELDALGYVWCTGPCGSGQFRYTEPKEITPEFLGHAADVVARLKARGPTSSNKKEDK